MGGRQEHFKVKSASREVGTLGNQQCMSQTIETCKYSWMFTCLVFVLQKCHECFMWSMIIVIYRKNPKPSQAHPERRKQVWTEQTAGGPTKQEIKLSERVKLFSCMDWVDYSFPVLKETTSTSVGLGNAFGAIDARKRCRRAEPWATKAVSAFTSSDCIQIFAWKKSSTHLSKRRIIWNLQILGETAMPRTQCTGKFPWISHFLQNLQEQ